MPGLTPVPDRVQPFTPTRGLSSCMSAQDETLADLRDALLAGRLTVEQFRDQLPESFTADGKDQLWARWADQGLFEEPIQQEGFTSFRGNLVREVDRDGQREE